MNPDRRKTAKCQFCQAEFKHGRSSNGMFCSVACSAKKRKETNRQNWLSGKSDGTKASSGTTSSTVRDYLLEQANHCCSKCQWNQINPVTGKCPLEIDHIDGNSANNSPENLRVLCPNCHALTPTYRALNKGNADKTRLDYIFKRKGEKSRRGE